MTLHKTRLRRAMTVSMALRAASNVVLSAISARGFRTKEIHLLMQFIIKSSFINL